MVLRARCYRKLACWWSLRARRGWTGRMPSHAHTGSHALGEGSCHLVETTKGTSLTGRSAPLGAGNDGQSSAPGHWALGTVQLRREELAGTGAVCGRRVFTVQESAVGSPGSAVVYTRAYTYSLSLSHFVRTLLPSLATVQNR